MANTVDVDADALSRETQLLIAEYAALRAEILDNLQTARAVVTLYLVAIGTIFLSTLSGQVRPIVLLFVPIISALFWWVHLDTRMIIALIGGYLDTLSQRARELGSDKIFNWEQRIREHRPPLGLLPWKFGFALDGSAMPIYLTPSILSLSITYGGHDSKIAQAALSSRSEIADILLTLPWDAWTFSLVVLAIVLFRAIVTERAWWHIRD